MSDDLWDEMVGDPRAPSTGRVRNKTSVFACKQMGFATGVMRSRGNINIAPASKPIWLDDVRCLDEDPHWTKSPPTKLHECYHAGWGLANSTHEEDVDLTCTGTADQVEATPVTATFENVPTNHDGSSTFTFQIAFSAAIDITANDMRDHTLTVGGGTVTVFGYRVRD